MAQPCSFNARRRTPVPKRVPSGDRFADAAPSAEAGGALKTRGKGWMENGGAQGRDPRGAKTAVILRKGKNGGKR